MSTTIDSAARAQKIADHLVEHRLAACVQVTSPITSTYRWHDKVERSQEVMCLIKTRRESVEGVEAAIRSLHPYDNPEIIALPIVAGSAEYLAWIESETSAPKSDR